MNMIASMPYETNFAEPESVLAHMTANQKFNYDRICYGYSLADWVYMCHEALQQAKVDQPQMLIPGMFEFDSIVCCVGTLLEYLPVLLEKGDVTLKLAACFVDQGWYENLGHWMRHQPYQTNSKYLKPSKSLAENLSSLDNRRTLVITECVLKHLEF